MSIPQDTPDPDERRNALSAALEASEAGTLAPVPNAPEIEPQVPAEGAKPVAKPRDPNTGKFAPRAEAPPAVPDAPIAPEPAWKKPPGAWKADKHPIWSALPPEAQEYAFQREEEMRAGVEPLKTKAQIADQFQAAAEPFLPTMRGLGIEPIQAFKELASADHYLRTLPPNQKLPYAAQILKGYGIDLVIGENGQPAITNADPAVYNLQNELTNLKGTLQGFTQQQEQARQRDLQGEINSFAADHPHFDQLADRITGLLQSPLVGPGSPRERLQSAYEQALRLDPEIFAKSQADEAAKVVAEKTRTAQAAKASAVSPKSSTPGAITAPKATDRRSMLEEGFASIEGRF